MTENLMEQSVGFVGFRRKILEILHSRTGCTILSKLLSSLFLVLLTIAMTTWFFLLHTVNFGNLSPGLFDQPLHYDYYFNDSVSTPYVGKTKIFVITPTTKKRNAQRADLTRLSQTLRLVSNLHWVLVEDSETLSPVLERLLKRSTLNYTHLAVTSEPKLANKSRGMSQRNAGLQWVRNQYKNVPLDEVDAVVYFGDDDNTYDIRVFNDYIRNVKKVGIWAIAFPTNAKVETPIVQNKTVVGWNVSWAPKRPFATDMAGFAVHLRTFLQHGNASFNDHCKLSNFEPCLLLQLNITKADLEPFGFDLPYGERDILVWHTKTKQNEIKLKGDSKGYIY